MSQENSLVVVGRRTAGNVRLTPRKRVQRLLAGAGAAWPMVASSHPIYGRWRNHVAVFDAAEKLTHTDRKPASQQHNSLATIAEGIGSGASKAQVIRFVDLLPSADQPENQHQFVESLAAFDAETVTQFGKRFLTPDEKKENSFLTDASTKAEKPNVFAAEAEQKQTTLYAHFENLKGWISRTYYLPRWACGNWAGRESTCSRNAPAARIRTAASHRRADSGAHKCML